MKKGFIIIVLLCCWGMALSQTSSTDSVIKPFIDTPSAPPVIKPVKKHKIIISAPAKHIDSTKTKDSVVIRHDSIPPPIVLPLNIKNDTNIFLRNRWLSLSGKPAYMINSEHTYHSDEIIFYTICSFLLLFGLFKVLYSRYFNNVFKVFFNTSLRQNQLTDILLQARLASLMFNILFVISAGLYVWQLIIYKGYFSANNIIWLPCCIGLVVLIYTVKFLIIKFMGWITTFNTAANQYIFVIFLINKIIAVFLIPFIILIALGPREWLSSIMLLSYLLIGTLFMLRYFRTYGLLQKQLSLNLFHFLLYLVGIEILPLIALYHLFISYNGYLDRLLT